MCDDLKKGGRVGESVEGGNRSGKEKKINVCSPKGKKL
jgi:hypothetical protein